MRGKGQQNAITAHHATSKAEATSTVDLFDRNEMYMHVVPHERDMHIPLLPPAGNHFSLCTCVWTLFTC